MCRSRAPQCVAECTGVAGSRAGGCESASALPQGRSHASASHMGFVFVCAGGLGAGAPKRTVAGESALLSPSCHGSAGRATATCCYCVLTMPRIRRQRTAALRASFRPHQGHGPLNDNPTIFASCVTGASRHIGTRSRNALPEPAVDQAVREDIGAWKTGVPAACPIADPNVSKLAYALTRGTQLVMLRTVVGAARFRGGVS